MSEGAKERPFFMKRNYVATHSGEEIGMEREKNIGDDVPRWIFNLQDE